MNYSELQSSIADFLNRSDLTAVIPTFIQLAEARMNRIIRTRKMESRTTENVSTQFVALPTDFLEYRNLQLNLSPVVVLAYVTPQYADTLRAGSIQGRPRFFTVVANQLELIPAPQETMELESVYYRRIPALSGMATSNWLIESHPDIYLYGSLVQAALYLKDDPTVWASLFDSAVDELMQEDQGALFHGTTPLMRGIQIG